MKKYLVLFALIGISLLTANQNMTEAKMLSLSCTNCHNTNGKSSGIVPSITSKNKAYLIKTLKDFKSGKRKSTIMQKHMKGFSNTEIEKIANYFSSKGN